MQDLVIVGAGGFGREVADVVEAINRKRGEWRLRGVVDDNPSQENLERLERRKIAYLGTIEELVAQPERPSYVVGIGAPSVRQRIVGRLDGLGFEAATLIHPAATIGSQVTLGAGAIICAGASLTTNIAVGRHVHVNPGVAIGHDTSIGDFVSLNPQSSISGDCVLEGGVLVGVAGVILNQIRVGAGATVGGAACVVRNVPPGAVVKGVPAR